MSVPSTNRHYVDGEPVPYPAYRCKAKVQFKNGTSHPCRRQVDHEGDHKCICSKTWERCES